MAAKSKKKKQTFLTDYPWEQHSMSNHDKQKARAIIRMYAKREKPDQLDLFSMTNFTHFVIDKLAEEKQEWLRLDEEHRTLKVPKYKDLCDWVERILAEMLPITPQRRSG